MAKDADFSRLLDYLRAGRGFDFSGYKLSSLVRRVQKRMADVRVTGYDDYVDYLEVYPDEFQHLFNTVLINVTGFFRDPQAWEFVAGSVIPRLLEERGPERQVRVWSAGCASGEEAYTLAMLLAEAMGEHDFRERAKIYATDADEEALAQARQASFDERGIQGVPPELLSKYFDQKEGRYLFRPDLRRSLIFGRHDLVQDAAISRVDLLACRNTLMYFNLETQTKILARFHFALNHDGYLFLGKAETPLTHGGSFRPVDLKRRVFQRTSSTSMRDRLLALAAPHEGSPAEGTREVRLREAAFHNGPVAQVVVDHRGYLLLANQLARSLLHLGKAELGRLLQDLELSYRPVELRSHIDQVYRERADVRLTHIPWPGRRGEIRHLEVQFTPLTDERGGMLGVGIAFLDLTQERLLREELERANQELETAYEELQSANEELRTMNDELQQRGIALDDLNGLLELILGGLRAGVVVVDRSLAVEVWSQRAEDLWGLRSEEVVGQPLAQLDIGIPVGRLVRPLRDSLDSPDGDRRVELDGINRRGKPIRCRITLTPLSDGQSGRKVLLLMEESPREEVPGAGADGGSDAIQDCSLVGPAG